MKETTAASTALPILMVAFHFPPQAGSSGMLRTLNFVRDLPSLGWMPAVLTAISLAYPERKNDLLDAIPADLRVMRAPSLDTARHLSIAGKYPRAFALPDRWCTWFPGALLYGVWHILRHRPKAIWSTYPLATAHLIGASLSRLTGLPWVADFRDPMLVDALVPNSFHRRLWAWLESYTLQNASACVFTTERAAEQYRLRYPHAAERCVVVQNGYDEQAFAGVVAVREGVRPQARLFLHSGLIYPQDRDPSTFFEALAGLIEDGVLPRESVCVRFRAPGHGDQVSSLASGRGLSDVVDVCGHLPYRQALGEMMGADVLLVFQGSKFNAQIPAKIYEYLRAGRPVFAVVDPLGDTAAELRHFDGVWIANIADAAHIRQQLKRLLAGEPDIAEGVPGTKRSVETLARSRQCEVLSEVLTRCVAQASPGARP